MRARGREWIVLTGSDEESLRLRPLSGSEEDAALIHLPLEPGKVTEATFPLPGPEYRGDQAAALLLRDALLLSLRRGAGPFRSFGQISVEPRAYQLVPLLMALKLDVARLVIADDVGVGKTIEGALIARELLDRGEIQRFAVLCPPHLVDQWTRELELHFNLRAAAVTATSAARLERGLPPSESIFQAHPFTVVSLDYIKSDKRRADFTRACPEFVIVDEAHTCVATGAGRHQRHELLRDLARDRERHLVLLTATPHSGDDDAFYRLLGLLNPKFEALRESAGEKRNELREELARHFVQRRRPDIVEWKEGTVFPKRETKELTYRLSGAWERFFEDVLDYCAAIVGEAEGDERRQRLNFWGTLALMRCAASSPAAAMQALRTRAGLADDGPDEEELQDRVFDGAADKLPDDDVEPPAGRVDATLEKLIAQAETLTGQAGDPKLKVLTDHLEDLLQDGYDPVVFCRYIATAHYLGSHLGKKLKGVTLDVVTGELTSDERRERVERLGDAEGRRLLIATDCLSEGINLQEHFNAVVHYDLSWNPTRHEQREGRVDRFGQLAKTVRTTLMYGANNPVDGAVLEVILRKAERIRQELGVPVPLPDDNNTLTNALMRAVFLRRGQQPRQQQLFDFGSTDEGKAIERGWRDAAEKAKANRTVFAQRTLKPDEVLPEWRKTLAALGGAEDVKRFTSRALQRFGSKVEKRAKGYRVNLTDVPVDVRERLAAEGLEGALLVDFNYPPASRCRPVQRSHPLVAILAETLLERTLGAEDDALGRVACWRSAAVEVQTTIAILRLRHQLAAQHRNTALVVEEAAAIGWSGALNPALIEGLDALTLIAPDPADNVPTALADRAIAQALALVSDRRVELDVFARRRAGELLADHRRVREAARARGSWSVNALLPADVIGLFVLLPVVR